MLDLSPISCFQFLLPVTKTHMTYLKTKITDVKIASFEIGEKHHLLPSLPFFWCFLNRKKSRPFVGGDFSYAVVLSKFPEGSTGSGATSRASLWRWGSRNGGGFNKNLWAFFFSEGQDAQEIQNASRCTKIIGSAIAELLRNDH